MTAEDVCGAAEPIIEEENGLDHSSQNTLDNGRIGNAASILPSSALLPPTQATTIGFNKQEYKVSPEISQAPSSPKAAPQFTCQAWRELSERNPWSRSTIAPALKWCSLSCLTRPNSSTIAGKRQDINVSTNKADDDDDDDDPIDIEPEPILPQFASRQFTATPSRRLALLLRRRVFQQRKRFSMEPRPIGQCLGVRLPSRSF